MLNRVTLMGRLTSDPEHKQTPNGIAVTSFSVAVDRNFADKDGKRGTDFINVVAWRQTADFICKYFAKGRMIALDGSIQTRNYEDKYGNRRTAFEIVAENVYFADSKLMEEKENSQFQPPANGFSVGDFEEVDDDSLPF